MKLGSIFILVFGLSAWSMPIRADATIVFSGLLQSGDGPEFGLLPPELEFQVELDFTETLPGLALIDSGTFFSDFGNLDVTGGDIVLIEGGSTDQALVTFDTSSSGFFSVNFIGDAITTNEITSDNLQALIQAATPSAVALGFVGGGNYSGITAVPEPSSCWFTVSAVAAICFRRRRKR